MIRIVENPPRGAWDALCRRAGTEADPVLEARVASIIAQVRAGGDRALKRLTEEIDGVRPDSLRVTDGEFRRAEAAVDPALKEAIAVAARNIETFHTAQLPAAVDMEVLPGVRCSQRAVPLRSVGLYVPGGSAPLFSTVLMLGIPARAAGCLRRVLCTPPAADGSIAPAILYAAQVCGIGEVYKVGGAQAVAAMALGTESVPRVVKVFGPGNRWVTAAKQQLGLTDVAIDMPAGPSEVMVLADDTAVAEFVAADLLSQAEHGADSQAVLVASSRAVAERVCGCLAVQLERLPRAETARKALAGSYAVVFDGPEDMAAFADAYAPEHLIVSTADAQAVAGRILTAGSIFLGNYTPESAGDYASGTNHTLPTAGWARAFGGLGTESFMRRVSCQEITPGGLRTLGDTVMAMARAEGLEAHARGVEIRLGKK